MTRRTFAAGLTAVFIAGLAVRLIGTGWGAPDGYHYDERFVLAPALGIVATGDPNPHFFNYPSGLIYATSWVVRAHSALGDMPLDLPSGPSYGPADLGAWTWPALRDSRRMVAVLGALGILAGALLAARTGGATAGLLAAALVASFALHAEHSHFLTTDVPMSTLVTLAFALAARPGRSMTAGLASGAVLGLAIATKYTAGFALVPVVIVNLVAGGGPARAALVAPAAAVAFFAVCPFALIDSQRFLADLATVRDHYRAGHLGAQGDGNWGWYLMRLRQEGLGAIGMGVFALGLAGVVAGVAGAVSDESAEKTAGSSDGAGRGARRGAVIALVVALTALAWFAWLGSVKVRFERNLLPAATLAAVAAGHGLAVLIARVPARRVAVGAVVLALLAPSALAVARSAKLAGDDTRSLARDWIEANLPDGSVIVREEYTPRPDPNRFAVRHVWSLSNHDPVWYRNAGIDYVIVSSAIHNRYRAPEDPRSMRYRRLFLWPRAARFVPGPRVHGPAVTVLRVPRAVPSTPPARRP